jgi:type I restriction enzyme S subunit
MEKTTIVKWFYYVTTTIHFDYFQYGSAVPSMTQEDLHNIYFATPLKEEQIQIAQYLDEKTSKIDELINKATKAIDLLKEKRTALISAAVTGKIDVREQIL